MAEQQYPYTDEYMKWDELEGRYYITEKALLSKGINVRERVSGVSADSVINGIVTMSGDMVYNFIHQHNGDNETQDRLIATVPSLRRVMYRALLRQAVYYMANGDLSLSLEDEKRSKALSEEVRRELNTTIPELGTCILYQGRWGY